MSLQMNVPNPICNRSLSSNAMVSTSSSSCSVNLSSSIRNKRRAVSYNSIPRLDPADKNGYRTRRPPEDDGWKVPDGCGLWIRLEQRMDKGDAIHETTRTTSATTITRTAEQQGTLAPKIVMECEADQHYPKIHPNCYAPAGFTAVRLLKGGGSGTAVFEGVGHPKFGSSRNNSKIVMKHGNAKDTREVFSLAAVSEQLEMRGDSLGRQDLAVAMKRRIPEFVGVYISQYHLRDRANELHRTMRHNTVRSLLSEDLQIMTEAAKKGDTVSVSSSSSSEDESDQTDSSTEYEESETAEFVFQSRGEAAFQIMKEKSDKRELIVCSGKCSRVLEDNGGEPEEETLKVGFEVLLRQVILHVPAYDHHGMVREGYGFEFLRELADALASAQEVNSWKITLAQKSIGGPNPVNGAVVLTRGMLQGKLLQILMEEFTTVVNDLRALTRPEEKEVLSKVGAELQELRESKDVTKVSKTVDTFVGSAIRKNFAPVTGRFAQLRSFGRSFRKPRETELVLASDEELPARFLGKILKRGAVLSDIFEVPPAHHLPLDNMFHNNSEYWLHLIETAVSFEHESATSRIWTCGLTDAGLHNTFLSMERGLELFDLGEPQLMPQPAFLTKFLMSFFHALGMEDKENDDTGGWVCRFEVSKNGKLQLTSATQRLISSVYGSFAHTLEYFIHNLFGGDDRVGQQLVHYVVLQLLSDAAFCLGRWEQKGGGRTRYEERANTSLNKWLWRCLWDLYIASDVHSRLIGNFRC